MQQSADVEALLAACPFLRSRVDLQDGPYGVMGAVALMIKARELSDTEIDQVFSVFNDLAEQDTCDRELLATGALEILNDDAATQRLARAGLRGRARALLEQMRTFWGQPDYG